MGKGSDINIARKGEMTRAPGDGAPDLSVDSTQGKVDSSIRALLLASVGSAFEFYDFVVFIFFASTISQLFFPSTVPDWDRKLESYAIFAAAYVVRPLGGIVIAHVGDTWGLGASGRRFMNRSPRRMNSAKVMQTLNTGSNMPSTRKADLLPM